ncbi:MAG: carbon-nitrogen hydrolase family protein, partial [Planctomycetes bacterium]|nr:carbon-nitrogen hydrolase family protein [Planctomycetota bacterium]
MNQPETTRVAAVAMNCAMGDPSVNLDRIERWAERAASEGAAFAVFPEECLTGSMNKSDIPFERAREIAGQAHELAAARLPEICERTGMALAVGTIEPGEKLLRNSILVVGPTGVVATYHKVHMPNETEAKWFEPGDQLVVVTSQGWTFSVGICYDLNFPEVFRAGAVAGAEFFLLAVGNSGGPERAADHLKRYTRLIHASAAANGMYVLYCNQSG